MLTCLEKGKSLITWLDNWLDNIKVELKDYFLDFMFTAKKIIFVISPGYAFHMKSVFTLAAHYKMASYIESFGTNVTRYLFLASIISA